MKKLFASLITACWTFSAFGATATILNASYDVTREFYQEYNQAFARFWKEKTGNDVRINQSHAGSSKQARSVLDGLEADVLTMNNYLDIEILHERGKLIPADWAARLPNHSVPNSSTILFVVRKGNPKNIKNWDDLVKPGVSVIIPNPKTSGNGRYSYLAAWGFALQNNNGDKQAAQAFVATLFKNVPVLDTGGRGATTTFVQRGVGDVLLTFENEVSQTIKESGANGLEAIVPSASILAENPVTWVDKVVEKRRSGELAKAYLEYLFSEPGQELAAKYYFRPSNEEVLKKYGERFKPLKLFTVAEVFGSWEEAQKTHFSEGGVFDQIYKP